MLTNITHLPVTKDMVANSKLGKAVVAIGNHKICTGGGNENAIKERIAAFKDEWSASVKHQLKIVSFHSRLLNEISFFLACSKLLVLSILSNLG